MKLCYIGRVPTNWWPRRVLCALWTRRPIVKVAMGCRTEPAAVHIAHVLQRLDFFQFFNFFYNLHDLQQKKKNYTHLQHKKKITRLYGFFVHDLHFSPLYWCSSWMVMQSVLSCWTPPPPQRHKPIWPTKGVYKILGRLNLGGSGVHWRKAWHAQVCAEYDQLPPRLFIPHPEWRLVGEGPQIA